MPSNSSPLKVPNASFTRKEDPSPAETEEQNYIVLRECLSGPIIQKLAPSSTSGVGGRTIGNAKARRKSQRNIFVNQSTTKKKTDKKTNEDSRTSSTTIRDDNKAKLENSVELQEGSRIGLDVQSANESDHGDAVEDLVEFIDYLTTELFSSLPPELRALDYGTHASSISLRERYTPPLEPATLATLLGLVPNTIPDSLLSYKLLPTHEHVPIFLSAVLNDYVSQVIAPPPSIALAASSGTSSSSTKAQLEALRPSACELCGRDWIPLTYHHLIPRSTHDKVRKRGWHPEWRLNAVAWLCRACHDFVHRVASNEELAKDWWSLERLRSREDTQVWVEWVGRVRWKKR